MIKIIKMIKAFINDKKGGLIENIIYIIIIGALSYTFYTEKVQAPMENNMDTLNDQITEWTTIDNE